MGKYLLAIDQGTSSSRTVIYDHETNVVASAQQEFPQIYPQSGWVEHDPEAIWASVRAVTAEAMGSAGAAAQDITAIGITNQRETTLLWDRETGECVYNAIVWQDRRTAEYCRSLKKNGIESVVSSKSASSAAFSGAAARPVSRASRARRSSRTDCSSRPSCNSACRRLARAMSSATTKSFASA